jgi:hypothetical protein
MDPLQELRTANPDVEQMMNAYAEIDAAYKDILAAMGQETRPALTVINSADLSVSFQGSSTSSR